MTNYNPTPEGRDPHLWRIAQARASFGAHLRTYLLMSVVFWAIWFFTGGPSYTKGFLPWPVWPMFGWGIGVAFHYLGAYRNNGPDKVEQEYQKLVDRK